MRACVGAGEGACEGAGMAAVRCRRAPAPTRPCPTLSHRCPRDCSPVRPAVIIAIPAGGIRWAGRRRAGRMEDSICGATHAGALR